MNILEALSYILDQLSNKKFLEVHQLKLYTVELCTYTLLIHFLTCFSNRKTVAEGVVGFNSKDCIGRALFKMKFFPSRIS